MARHLVLVGILSIVGCSPDAKVTRKRVPETNISKYRGFDQKATDAEANAGSTTTVDSKTPEKAGEKTTTDTKAGSATNVADGKNQEKSGDPKTSDPADKKPETDKGRKDEKIPVRNAALSSDIALAYTGHQLAYNDCDKASGHLNDYLTLN